MSVYLSVAPPDGFTRWGDPDWGPLAPRASVGSG